jgi:hypothetical protein
MKLEIEKSQGQSYYVVERLYNRPKKGYSWEDEGRTFSTVESAEEYIKMHASQCERYATDRFHVIKKESVEIVNVKFE